VLDLLEEAGRVAQASRQVQEDTHDWSTTGQPDRQALAGCGGRRSRYVIAQPATPSACKVGRALQVPWLFLPFCLLSFAL